MTHMQLYRSMIFLALIAMVTISVSGQNSKENMTLAKLNPLGMFASTIPLSLEQMIGGNRYSLIAGGSLTQSKSGSGESTYNNSGFSISPEFRYYFSNEVEVSARTYAGVWLNYEEHTNTTADRYGDPVHGHSYGRGTGILIGNQMVFKNKFLVDIFVGPGYMQYESTENYHLNITKGGFLTSLTGPKNSGTKIRFGFAVGLSL